VPPCGVKGAMAAGLFGALGAVLGLVRSFSGSSTATKTLPPLANFAAAIASLVLIALAIAVACGVHALLGAIGGNAGTPFFENVPNWTWLVPGAFSAQPSTWLHALPPAWSLLVISVLVAGLLGWRVRHQPLLPARHVQESPDSLLSRCIESPARARTCSTGFDPADDIALADLAPLLPGGTPEEPLRAQPQRPFHIFNMALNLVHGSELSWQERKAALFVLTPTFCGFNLSPASGDKPLSANTREVAGNEAHEQAFRPTALYADSASGSEQAQYTTHAQNNMPTSVGQRQSHRLHAGHGDGDFRAAGKPEHGRQFANRHWPC